MQSGWRKIQDATRSFTMIEVVISVAILTFVVALGIASLSAWRNRNNLDIARRAIESTLRLARSKSLASEGAAEYGVVFYDYTQGTETANTYRLCKNPAEDICLPIPPSGFGSPCAICSESISYQKLPSGIAFCMYVGSNNNLNAHLKSATALPSNTIWPFIRFSRLSGRYENIQAPPIEEGNVYFYDTRRIANPCNSQTLLEQCLRDKTCAGITINGDGIITKKVYRYAYVADKGSKKLVIIDVTNPLTPVVRGSTPVSGSSGDTWDLNSPEGIAVNGRYAYVIDSGDNDLKIFDILNSQSPSFVSSVTIDSEPEDIAVLGDYAFVVDQLTQKIQSINVSNPQSPVLAGSTVINFGIGDLNALDISYPYAFVVDDVFNDLIAVNIANPAAPAEVFPQVTIPGSSPNPEGIRAFGKYAYVVDSGTDKLYIFDVSNPGMTMWAPLGSLTVGTSPQAVAVSGGYAYSIDDGASDLDLKSTNISNSTVPVIGADLPSVGCSPQDISILGAYVYFICEAGTPRLNIYSIANPKTPVLVSGSPFSFAEFSDPRSIAVAEYYAPDGPSKMPYPAKTQTVTFRDGLNGYSGTTDTYMNSAAATTNYGGVDISTNGNPDQGALLRWDISSIPSGSTIIAASMTLQITNGINIYNILYEVKRPWTEFGATWNRYDATNNWATAGAGNTTSDRGSVELAEITTFTGTGLRSFALNENAVALIQSWVNGAPNYGFTFQNYAAANDTFAFRSREYATATDRPALTITYVAP